MWPRCSVAASHDPSQLPSNGGAHGPILGAGPPSRPPVGRPMGSARPTPRVDCSHCTPLLNWPLLDHRATRVGGDALGSELLRSKFEALLFYLTNEENPGGLRHGRRRPTRTQPAALTAALVRPATPAPTGNGKCGGSATAIAGVRWPRASEQPTPAARAGSSLDSPRCPPKGGW